jgi:hypothetical protein
MPVAVAPNAQPQQPVEVEQEHWGPFRIRFRGKMLRPELASLVVAVSILVVAVLLLGLWRVVRDRPVSAPVAHAHVGFDFRAMPHVITAGDTTILHWNAPGATSIRLQPGGTFGAAESTASIRVKPFQTTTYTLTAEFPARSQTKMVTVTVNPHP